MEHSIGWVHYLSKAESILAIPGLTAACTEYKISPGSLTNKSIFTFYPTYYVTGNSNHNFMVMKGLIESSDPIRNP